MSLELLVLLVAGFGVSFYWWLFSSISRARKEYFAAIDALAEDPTQVQRALNAGRRYSAMLGFARQYYSEAAIANDIQAALAEHQRLFDEENDEDDAPALSDLFAFLEVGFSEGKFSEEEYQRKKAVILRRARSDIGDVVPSESIKTQADLLLALELDYQAGLALEDRYQQTKARLLKALAEDGYGPD